MGFNRGISANVKLPPGSKSGGNSNIQQALTQIQGAKEIGRVTDIILNQNYPDIEKYGGLNGIGTIFFELNNVQNPGRGIAKPFYPQLSAYPLVNELVLLFKLPNNNIGRNTSEESYYYINMVSLWNHPHHNAYPNPITSTTLPDSQQKDYQQTEAGSVRRVTDESTEIDLNSPINPSQATFVERINIHPLLPFAGDIMYQGRWGNSIRFGSTAKPTDINALNDWSEVGENGDPITIIRNGQPSESSDEGWVPITEDINNDLSSIYQTSTQQIPIEVSNQNYGAYSTPPDSPETFDKPQVIINSGRLVFNSKNDHVLISAEKSIFLGSNSSINFSTKEHIVDSPIIKLGGKGANESVIKGDLFLAELQQIMTALNVLATTLSTDTIWPVGAPAPNAAVNAAAVTLSNLIPQFTGKIESYKSNITKTK